MTLSNERSTRSQSSHPKTERRNRDQEVIKAAIQIISEQGFTGTSVQDIADAVGILKGSLYHYFDSKEDLLYRILTESHSQSRNIAAEVATLGLSPLEELCEFLQRISLWFLQNTERANIFFREARHLSGERREKIREQGQSFNRHLYDLIRMGQMKGEITEIESTLILTEYVLGSLNNVRDWPRRIRREHSIDELSAGFVRLTRKVLAR